jgi:general secretion pathway protein G
MRVFVTHLFTLLKRYAVKCSLILVLYALVIGCANQTELAKQSLILKIHSEYPVEFRNLVNYPGNVSCGEYKSFGKWGGGTKFLPFIFRAQQIDTHPIKLDVQIFCASDPAASIYAKLGIDTSIYLEQELEHVQEDFHQLSAALEIYYQRNHTYPSARKGLEALVSPEKHGSKPGPLENGRYLDRLPQDPWKRAYFYQGAGLAGVKHEPEYFTLGKDAKLGGKNENADIKTI